MASPIQFVDLTRIFFDPLPICVILSRLGNVKILLLFAYGDGDKPSCAGLLRLREVN